MADGTQKFPQYDDAVHVAAQLGRLDFVSVLLASIAVLLALAGIFAFFSVRNSARITAKETAEEIATKIAEQVANAYLQEKLPEIIDAYRDFIQNGVDQRIADQIAQAQENDGN